MRSIRTIGALTALALLGCGGGGGHKSGSSTTVTAPAITTQPTPQSVAVGGSATFAVVATGSSLTYQWYKFDNATSAGVAVSGATSSSYTISSATTDNAGSYYVVVTNSAESLKSDVVALTVSTTTGDAGVTIN